MPILTVTLITAEEDHLPDDCAAQIAEQAASVLGSRPDGTWVILDTIPESRYAEGDGGPPAGVRPAFVRLLQFESSDPEHRRKWVSELAIGLAPVLNRPAENIHVIFEPPGQGRIAFGGRLRE